MRAKTFLVVTGLAAGLFTFGSLIAKQPAKPGKGGTDILHWFVRKAMTNEDTNSHATAWVDLKQNKQGRANNQRIDLRVRSLETNAPYQLWAALNEETNFVHVADFTAHAKGNANVKLMKIGAAKGKPAGKGKGPVHSDVDPISQIRELAIGNVNTQMVFSANLTAPDKLHYLIKRSVRDADGVDANLQLKSNLKQMQFRLQVWGLSPTNSYQLVLNGEPVTSGNSATNGMLSFTSLPVSAADILTVRELSLWDSASNSVINFNLP